MPIHHHRQQDRDRDQDRECHQKKCPKGYDIGSPDQALAAIAAITAAGHLDEYSYLVPGTAQYDEVHLTAESKHGHGKIGYNVVLQRGSNFNVIQAFGNRVGSCPDFLDGFNVNPDGRLVAGDRLFLLAIRLSLEHRITCSTVKLIFKNDVPPPNVAMTLMTL